MNLDWVIWLTAILAIAVVCGVVAYRNDRTRRDLQFWENKKAHDDWWDNDRADDTVRISGEEWTDRLRRRRAVRRFTPAEMDAEADRIQDELAADPWPTAVNPRVHERAHMTPAPQPLPERRFATRPIAEIDTYLGDAAWTAEAFRSGGSVADETYNEATRVLRGMSRELPAVVDAPVSPAYVPRHDGTRPAAHPIGYDRAALRVLNEATGSWPIVRRELERAS